LSPCTYNWRGQSLTQTDQAGHVTFNVYDLAGQLTQTTTAYNTPDAATTQYTYDVAGRRTSTIDPRGNTTKSVYDDAGRLVQTIDALGETTSYTLDAAGRQTAVTDALGRMTQYAYDARGRVTQVTYPDGTTTSSTYDGTGHVTALTDQAGNVTHSVFDGAGQLQSVTGAMSQTTGYTYDKNGNLLTRTDANNHTTTLTYDVMNRVKTRTIPGGGAVENFDYNLTGTVADVTDFNGNKTTFTYDPLMDRLVTRTPAAVFNEKPVTYTYWPNGQRETMTDASGTTTYTYDNQNRLLTKATPLAGTLTYTYDKAGNRLTVVSSNTNGTSVVYTYDNLNRVQTVVDNNAQPGLNLTAYSFDAVGNLSSTELANGVTVTPSVDLMNRVKELAATGKPGAAYSYQYGLVGNRTYAAGSAGGPLVSASYTYDSIYRLTQESLASAGVQAENGALTYGLDPVGNRQTLTSTLSAIATQPPMSYNANDRLLTNSYDANGNTLGAGGKTFAYDSQDRLTSFNGGAVTMVYDGDGNRVSKTAGGVTTVYLVDEANPTGLAQVVEEIAGGAVKTRYLYGLERIGQTQVASGTTSFYGYDGHGDVRYLTDVAGKVTDTYDYDAFGNVVGSTGTTANVYRYQGEAFDSETGLYYLRARYYDPVAGRFLSVDPLADQGQHPYTYAGADPVNGHDPTGTQDFIEYSMATAVVVPSAAVMAGMAADLKCIASLALSRLLGPAAVMVGVKGCLAMFRDTREPSTPGPGSPSDPDKPCKCKDKQCCKWIDAHGSDASHAAAELGLQGTTGEADILGISAIESGWGHPAFKNAFFGMHGPLPGQEACVKAARNPTECVSTFSDYLASAEAFVWKEKSLLQGKTDPGQFAAIANGPVAKFGWGDIGGGKFGPLPNYIPDLVGTIHHLDKCLKSAGGQ
jgi:RHS repeat-associated protein